MLLNKTENKVIGANPIVRYGEVISPKVIFELKTKIGYSVNSIIEEIKNKIVEYSNNLKLEEKLDASDIISISYVDGVDNIKNIRFIVNDQEMDTINCKIYQYIRISKENIIIGV